MKKTIYKITINNWLKYNGSLKSGHKKIMISTGFLTDAKIRMLSAGGKLLYLGLLLRCGEVNTNLIECSHDVLVTFAGGRGYVVSTLLDQLQSLQLLSYEEIDLLNNRIEKNRIEKNRIEVPARSKLNQNAKELNQKIWESYKQAYLHKYKVEPVRNASVNAKISQLGKRLGDEAILVIAFYLTHNDFFYIKNLHSIGLCLSHAESLRTQMLRGKAITSSDVKTFEKRSEFNNLIKDIEDNGI